MPLVADPPEVVTLIGPVVAPSGTMAVICVEEFTVMFVAVTPLNLTWVGPANPVPDMTTEAPIWLDAGLTLVIVGAGNVLVKGKLTGLIAALLNTEVNTVKFPGALLAVNVGEAAIPTVLVMAIAVCWLEGNVPVAGLEGGFDVGAAN